eukprot:PhF_6_TR30612/c0_g1_i3/m.45076
MTDVTQRSLAPTLGVAPLTFYQGGNIRPPPSPHTKPLPSISMITKIDVGPLQKSQEMAMMKTKQQQPPISSSTPSHSNSRFRPDGTIDPEKDPNVFVPIVVKKLNLLAMLKQKNLALRQVMVGLTLASLLPAVFLMQKLNLTWKYETFLSVVLTATICMSQICIWNVYQVKLTRRHLTDSLAHAQGTVFSSPYLFTYLRQAITFLLHCPPGLR